MLLAVYSAPGERPLKKRALIMTISASCVSGRAKRLSSTFRNWRPREFPLPANISRSITPTCIALELKSFPGAGAKSFAQPVLILPNTRSRPTSGTKFRPKQQARKESILARDAPSKLFQFVREQLKMSWVDYLESLGISDHGSHKVRQWNRKMVISEIRRLKAEGCMLNYQSVAQADQSLIVHARKFFGSWDAARAAARV